MKIGLVLDDTLDTPDGVQQYVLHVGQWLSEQGHEVHYLVGNTTRTDLANVHSLSRNLRVRFNGNRMSMPLPTSPRKLRRFLAEQQFDVLHVQVPYSPFMAGMLLGVAPKDTAVVGTFHILPYSKLVSFANRCLGLLNHFSAKRFDLMVAVSQPAAEFARRVYGYDTSVVPNPVRLEQFAGAKSDDIHLNIVFLGRLVARKGSLLLLRAVALLKTQGKLADTVRIILGGKGELLPALQKFVEQHDLEQAVTFYGFVNEAEKADFLAQADIAIFPSVAGESFGIVLIEGMAVARGVVVGGNNPGYASVLRPLPAQLVNPKDIRAFADKLAYYLEHPDARQAAAEAQHAYVKQFDINVVGAQLVAVYEQALQSRRKS